MRDIVEILFLVSPSRAQGLEFHNRFFAGLWYLAIGHWPLAKPAHPIILWATKLRAPQRSAKY
jgi:hypothetical protein